MADVELIPTRSSCVVHNNTYRALTILGKYTLQPHTSADLFIAIDRLLEHEVIDALQIPFGSLYVQWLVKQSITITRLKLMITSGVISDPGLLSLGYSSNLLLDFNPALPLHRRVVLAGNVSFSTVNLAEGRQVSLRLDAGASTRSYTFPAGWKFIGAVAPISLAAGKTATLSLVAYGNSDSDIEAGYAAEP